MSNKEFLCITLTVEHNYISPNSTVGIQLHVSALYVGRGPPLKKRTSAKTAHPVETLLY